MCSFILYENVEKRKGKELESDASAVLDTLNRKRLLEEVPCELSRECSEDTAVHRVRAQHGRAGQELARGVARALGSMNEEESGN